MVPFLVYHRITEEQQAGFRSIHPDTFRHHLEIIRSAGVPVVDPADASLSGDSVSGVVLTFDDATIDHFDTARPILSEFDVPGLFYVPTARLGSEGHLSVEQVTALHREGHTIGSHSHTHSRLDRLPTLSVHHELHESRRRLREILGVDALHFAPPGGLYGAEVSAVAQEVGFRFFRTMMWGLNPQLDPHEIHVVPMVRPSGTLFLRWALNGRNERVLRVMYELKRTLRGGLAARGNRSRTRD